MTHVQKGLDTTEEENRENVASDKRSTQNARDIPAPPNQEF